MKAIAFIQDLKQALLEIESNHSESIFYVELDYDLIRKVKKYAFNKLHEIQNADSSGNIEPNEFIQDLLSRDIFNLRITYCIVKLREFLINEGEYFDYISNAIDCFLENRQYHPYHSAGTIKERLIREIANCFFTYYRPPDIFLIRFSQERQLTFVNPKIKNWQVSNIGRYFIELPYFEAISFLCALEIVLTLEIHKNAFVSKSLLEKLLSPSVSSEEDNATVPYNRPIPYSIPYSLTLFGVVEKSYDAHYDAHKMDKVTDFGKRVLSYVNSHLSAFQEIIISLFESEASGLKHLAEIDFEGFWQAIHNSTILTEGQKNSVQSSISSYKRGNFLSCLRDIYPVLEGTLNIVLEPIIPPQQLKGIHNKAQKLRAEGKISPELEQELVINARIRNNIVHGNILENNPELIKPLIPPVFNYFTKLLLEIDNPIGK